MTAEGSIPRVLFLGNVFPLPSDDGTKMRIRHLLQAVTSVASVDFFTLYGDDDPLGDADELGVARVGGIRRAEAWRPRSPTRWALSSLPRPWPYRDVSTARQAVAHFARGGYDLVWYSRVETYLTFGPVPARRHVVDFDVLEDERLTTSARVEQRRALRDLADRIDRARWHKVQQRVADRVDLSIVCNATDRRRLGGGTVTIVPNGYEERRPITRTPSSPPTVGFVGSFAYGPNVDAARTLIEEVMPVVRSRVADSRLLLVGRRGDELFGTDSPAWVQTTGFVETVEPWLEPIDVMAVPVRYGGGTRIKILEALCHRIPLVAYRYATEGIDVVDGIHAILVETPDELADGVTTLLRRPEEGERLAVSGRRLFETRYRWSSIRDQVAALVEELTQR